jgi:hypothetical protein
MMGYRGVKFDPTGQNTLAATYLIQLQGNSYLFRQAADMVDKILRGETRSASNPRRDFLVAAVTRQGERTR